MQHMQQKQKLVLIILISVIFFSPAGYFIGKYYDTKANNQAIAAKSEEDLTGKTMEYNNGNWGILLYFPLGWTYKEEDNSYEVTPDVSGLDNSYYVIQGKLIISSPSGSTFVYKKEDKSSATTEKIEICDANSNKEDDLIHVSDCIEKDKFSRFITDSELAKGEVWHIAENHNSISQTSRTYLPYDGFYFQAVNDDDLKLMDAIVNSIQRYNKVEDIKNGN